MFSWNSLLRPFFVLAPMEDVTDTVFRRIVASCARPDVFVTEFVNTDGMFSEGKDIVSQRLKFSEEERPLIAQVWGIHPQSYFLASKRIVELGFDGIDINMGCPQKHVVHSGACAALIKNHSLTSEIIDATRRGMIEAGRQIPFSIKTRIGYNTIATEEWIGFLLSFKPDALTVHGRTAKEMSKVPAHWDEIGKAVKLRDKISPETVIIGNGDIKSREDGLQKAKEYGVDGIMIGRAIFENPWVFEKEQKEHSLSEHFGLLTKHVELFNSTWQGKKPFQVMKKYFKIYVRGFDGAAEFREKLMACESADEVQKILNSKF
ncbi:tRNA-dihydrouridine synthase [Candidatus Gottesmanbacteria bacterium]|nr:tRNA-dihydrouridine synthase [Candidatus Gottesmanbacteria bacterium]